MQKLIGLVMIVIGFMATAVSPALGLVLLIGGLLVTWSYEQEMNIKK